MLASLIDRWLAKIRRWLWANWHSVKKNKIIWEGIFLTEELKLYKYTQVNIHKASLNVTALRTLASMKWHVSAAGNFSYTKKQSEKFELHFHKGSWKPAHPLISMRNILQIPPRKCNIQCIISLWYMEPWNKQLTMIIFLLIYFKLFFSLLQRLCIRRAQVYSM